MPNLILVAALAAALPVQAEPRGPSAIDSLAMKAHTWFLSHDLLAGRGTGSSGTRIAAEYLAAAARQAGLRAAGEEGGYFQAVPLVDAVIEPAGTSLTLTDSAGSSTWRTPGSFLFNVGTLATLRDFGGEVAWVGSAVDVRSRPERLPPLQGRVAMMAGLFGAEAAAADTLRARGATGVLHLVGDDDVYQLYARSRGESRMSVADSTTPSSFIPNIPSVIVRASLARRLLAGVRSEEELAQPFVLDGRRVEVRVRVHARAVPERNVVAMIRGADARLRDEFVVYTAHYDHLGISEPDERGDSIYNGFSDNAAGSAMLLAIAAHFAAHPPPRSVLFIWFTGEERGLLGSDWFAAHPLVPPEKIAGVINLDAGAPPAPSVQWRISGGDRSALGPIALEVAREAGWEAQTSPASPNTDYFPFLRLGVPAVFLVPGPASFEGLTTDSSQALRRRWDRYHQAADEWANDYPFAGLVRYADFALRLGLRIASGPLLPRIPAR